MKQIVLNIDSNGTIQFVYDDELQSLVRGGDATIRRASHVEPTNSAVWVADLAPVGGPRLGPFLSRDEALAAEVGWLNVRLSNGQLVQIGE